MPYIDPKRRELVRPTSNEPAETAGELNFQVTSLLNDYLNAKVVQYSTINDILGVLDAAAKEFYRRIAAPYEDKKMLDNGDVFSKILPKPILEDRRQNPYPAPYPWETWTITTSTGSTSGTIASTASGTYTTTWKKPPEDPPEAQLTLF